MARLIETTFPRILSAGTVALTLNMQPEGLNFLSSSDFGRRYFSEDRKPAGGTQESMVRLYELLGRQRPQRFTSLALRTSESASRDQETLIGFGPVTLQIDFRSVADDLLIFNGDAQNLSYQLSEVVPINHKMETAPLLALLSELTRNKRKRMAPRQVGSYYEARLMRALLPSDISHIYVPGTQGRDQARSLCTDRN